MNHLQETINGNAITYSLEKMLCPMYNVSSDPAYLIKTFKFSKAGNHSVENRNDNKFKFFMCPCKIYV